VWRRPSAIRLLAPSRSGDAGGGAAVAAAAGDTWRGFLGIHIGTSLAEAGAAVKAG
jgi:hypothetical protein